jgi:hypothetical protein
MLTCAAARAHVHACASSKPEYEVELFVAGRARAEVEVHMRVDGAGESADNVRLFHSRACKLDVRVIAKGNKRSRCSESGGKGIVAAPRLPTFRSLRGSFGKL